MSKKKKGDGPRWEGGFPKEWSDLQIARVKKQAEEQLGYVTSAAALQDAAKWVLHAALEYGDRMRGTKNATIEQVEAWRQQLFAAAFNYHTLVRTVHGIKPDPPPEKP